MQTMRLHESIPVFLNFSVSPTFAIPGAAFGLLASSGQTFRLVFFGLTSVFALGLLGMIFYRLRQDDWVGQLSIAGILGGAIGNLLDRVRFGEVIDFLDFYINGYHWPAFNVADAAISVGVFFSFFTLRWKKKKRKGNCSRTAYSEDTANPCGRWNQAGKVTINPPFSLSCRC